MILMKALRKILHRLEELRLSGEPSALATLVSVRGSAYRRPGARMLFSKKGREAGFVSAACLEADLFEKVKDVIASGKPALLSYDTTAPEDAVFGIGQGCAGFVEILIEPTRIGQTEQSLALMQTVSEQNELCALATVYKSDGVNSEAIGAKLLFTVSGRKISSLIQTELSKNIMGDIEQSLLTRQSTVKHYDYSKSTAEVFIEVIQPSAPLLIFGATPDVGPLVRLAGELNWNITVVDHRSVYAVEKDFPEADDVLLLSPEDYIQHLHPTPETSAVIMIHQFAAEANALRFLLSSTVRYVGLLGPKSKCDLLLQHLASEGFTMAEEQLAKLHNPVGLDLGAETAEEIAISIVAEIQAVIHNRHGGFLKNRQGPIH
jgi:xanthine/CO dehydrogenase XdhC/CoxF family maturation factor